ncbi:MAG: DNA topoisomerase [Promethearchaeota archaeon]
MNILIISEKNKAAQAIAEALGNTKKIKVNKIVSVYEVSSQNIYVLPLRGHIQQYKNTPPYEKWTAKDPRDIITDPHAIAKIPNDYAGAYISALKIYGKKCDTCIVGTDADVEGCNIGLMDAVPFVKAQNPKIKLQQLWLNDLQKKTIQHAFQQLIPPKWSWAYSGEARAQIDAIIGFSATREVSLTLKPVLNSLNVKFASIGRVQTSLLYLIYLREDIIRNFKPIPFWTISADLQIGNSILRVNHQGNNFKDKKIAETIYQKIQHEKSAQLEKIQTNTREISPPPPLNTSRALQLITKNLKINAKQALQVLEELYLNKMITYPRTDSDVYSPNYDHKSTLQKFLTHSIYGNYTVDLFNKKRISPRQGRVNAGDHSPISPLKSLEPGAKEFENSRQERVYNLITRYYLALFGEKAKEADTRVLFDIKKEKFLGQIKILLSSGFYTIAPFLSPKYACSMPELTKFVDSNLPKPSFPIKKLNFNEKETQPPPRYTDTSLLQLMEQKKLGTKSTRPAMIQILIDRQYIQRKGRSIYLMDLGFLLIDALKTIWTPFLDPSFTAKVENLLQQVQNNQIKFDFAVNTIKAEFLQLFDLFRTQRSKILSKMQAIQQTGNVIRGRNNKIISSNASNKLSGKSQSNYLTNTNSKTGNSAPAPLTTAMCPKCKNIPMKLVISPQKKKKFLVCTDPNCQTYLSLPQKGTPRLLRATCSICNFNIVKISTSKNGHKFHYYICPLCWNHGLAHQTGEGFCSSCKAYHIVKGKCVKR